MRKVLIVSYHAPPRNVTTAHRIEALIWNLPKFGWQPIVCSGPPPNFSLYKLLRLDSEQNLMAQLAQMKAKLHIYSEKSWVDKLATFYGELFYYPDPMKGWADTMNAQFDFDKYRPDLVMSHSFPHTSHIVASRLNRSCNGKTVPWIVSMSDLWTQSHFYPYSRWRKAREVGLEEEVLGKAKCFITVSPSLAKKLEDSYYQHAFPIWNSYPKMPDVPLTEDFTVTYTGNFYAGKYDLELLCWALRNYRYKFPRLKVRFVGQAYPYLKRLVSCYALEDMVSFIPTVSHREALKYQSESQVLLQFVWNDPKQQGIYSAKLFEYIGARRPVVAFGGEDKAVGRLLTETNAGVWARTPEDFAHVLEGMYEDYLAYGMVRYNGNDKINEFSAEKMAEQHATIFDKIVK